VVIITISYEDTGTFVTGTLDIGEENREDSQGFTITSTSDDLATPQQAQRFQRTWAFAMEQMWFVEAPQALQHVLTVIRIWGQGAYTRIEATHQAAKEQGVTFHTIEDAYTRRLGNLHVADFDRLLKGNPLDLQNVLHDRYPEHFDVIESYMSYLD
jgi:hypothetical protein